MTQQPDQPAGRTDQNISDYAEVGKTLIQGIAPAEKGWILGFIIVVAIIVLSDAWVALKTLDASAAISEHNRTYFTIVEENRAGQADKMSQVFGDQVRRSQEVIRDLAQAVARDSERAGMAALSAIDSQTSNLELESRVNSAKELNSPIPNPPEITTEELPE